jgi:hypothetical protein
VSETCYLPPCSVVPPLLYYIIVVCNAVDVFEPKTLSLKHILNYTELLLLLLVLLLLLLFRKLVKVTIKSDRLRWLKYIDENLKSKPKHFWKYVASLGNPLIILSSLRLMVSI